MKRIARKEQDLTEGSIIKALWKLSIPIIFANFLQTAYNLTDTFWVGRLGASAVAAVSVSFPIIFLIVSLGAGLTISGAILVAQYRGKKDQKAINYIAAQTLTITTISALILSTLGYFISPSLLQLMHVNTSVFEKAVFYMRISFVGIIFMFLYAAFQSLMRGVGNVKIPMFIILGTVLLNLLLDPLFIFGFSFIPALGVSGAALATLITEFLSALTGLMILFSGRKEIKIHFRSLRPDFPLIKKMAALGWPSSLEQSIRSLGLTMVTFLVAGFGTSALAAYGIGMRILSFILIPAMGLSMAVSTLVGQNIGARKIERAEKTSKLGIIISFIGLTIAGIILFIFANPIVHFFIPGETTTIQTTSNFLRIMAFSFGFIGAQQVIKGIFRGAGQTLVAMALSLTFLLGLRLPLVYFLSYRTSLGINGVWWAFPISNILAGVIAAIFFGFGTWKKKRLTKEIKIKETIAETADVLEKLND